MMNKDFGNQWNQWENNSSGIFFCYKRTLKALLFSLYSPQRAQRSQI